MGVTRLKRKDRKNKTTIKVRSSIFESWLLTWNPEAVQLNLKHSQIAKNNAALLIAAGK